LVRETVGLIDSVGNGDLLAEEVRAARMSLRQLLERSSKLPRTPPWMLAQEATEVNGFLDLGIQVALGGGLGAAGVALATIAGGAVTGGIGPVAGFVVLGGVRRFQQIRAVRGEADRLAREHEKLSARVFSASAAAAMEYLNDVVALSTEPLRTEDPSADVKVSADLDALVDIARRFVLGEPRLRTVVKQSLLIHKNAQPDRLMPLFRDVHRVASRVRVRHADSGSINARSREELEQLRGSLRRVLEQTDK
jgi:hypothetical protein